ncbi:MAG: CIA30 family protein [Vicinamibacterales bacterium]
MVSDFDEADAIGGLPRVRFGAGWETSSDSAAGGASSVSLQVVRGGAGGTPGALRVRGILRPGARVRYAGAEFRPGSTPALGANLSAFKGLRFRARGDGGEYRVYLYGVTGSAPIARLDFRAGPEWAVVDLSFAESGIDGRGLRRILIAALDDPRTFAFLIDDVRLYR